MLKAIDLHTLQKFIKRVVAVSDDYWERKQAYLAFSTHQICSGYQLDCIT